MSEWAEMMLAFIAGRVISYQAIIPHSKEVRALARAAF